MGVVYAVQDPAIPVPRALKLIRADKTSPKLLKRFLREAHSLAKVQHPCVVRVFDSGQLPEGPYLLMELVEGRPLDEVARSCDPNEAARIVTGVGMGRAHVQHEAIR